MGAGIFLINLAQNNFTLKEMLNFLHNFSAFPRDPTPNEKLASASWLCSAAARGSAMCYRVSGWLLLTSLRADPGSPRGGAHTGGRRPADSLGSRLSRRRRNVDPVSSVEVKVEVEEARISEPGPSSAPLSAGNVAHRHWRKHIFRNEWTSTGF